jgi:hypothetical protein
MKRNTEKNRKNSSRNNWKNHSFKNKNSRKRYCRSPCRNGHFAEKTENNRSHVKSVEIIILINMS